MARPEQAGSTKAHAGDCSNDEFAKEAEVVVVDLEDGGGFIYSGAR